MPLDTTIVREAAPIRLGELLGTLSHALDLTEGQPPGHCLRVCWIGMRIGRTLGLTAEALADLHYALLLKDLGCSSNAARICQLYLADDRGFKADAKLLGDRLPEMLGFVLRHTGRDAAFTERVQATWRILRDGGEIVHDLIETRCEQGADIARRMRFSERVAKAIHALDERWDGRGKPLGLAGRAIPLFSRIALLAQVADVFHVEGGREAAMQAVRGRSGTWFDPELVAAFHSVAADRRFWEVLEGGDVERAVLDQEPAQRLVGSDEDYLDDIAAAFARVIDAKSPYTAGHSARVAVFAEAISGQLGLPAAQRRRLKRAALLHDIGKLGVSNRILDKPGRLDESEWMSMRCHPLASERILAGVTAFGEMAEVGGGHHEKLDGTGYPRGLVGEAIGLPTRIVSVADVCDALTARRPYRDAIEVPRALEMMRRDVGTAFDATCFGALEALAEGCDLTRLGF
jgi:HD-GYP domain-containing protein (c-di-GMP phosphodiesterase class II)